MDTVVAILKDNKVVDAISFADTPSDVEIQEFVELRGGSEGRKLTEYEIINANQEVEELIKPYPSWIWDSSNKMWKAPVDKTDPSFLLWDETERVWKASE